MATIPVAIQPGAQLADVKPKPGDTIEWRAAGKTFVLCFVPASHGRGDPVKEGLLIESDRNGIATATVRNGLKKNDRYRYYILITSPGAEDYVHGVHSPPEMVIQ